MKNTKTPREDDIIAELLKAGEEDVNIKLKELFNLAKEKETIPEKWNNTIIILILKEKKKNWQITDQSVSHIYISCS